MRTLCGGWPSQYILIEQDTEHDSLVPVVIFYRLILFSVCVFSYKVYLHL